MKNKKTIVINTTSVETNLDKFFEPIGPNDEMLLEYTLFDAIEAGFEKAVIVISDDLKNEVKKEIQLKFRRHIQFRWVVLYSNHESKFLDSVPAKICGINSYALWKAQSHIKGPFLLIDGQSYNGKCLYKKALEIMEEGNGELAVLNYKLGRTLSEFGCVDRSICVTKTNTNVLNHLLELKRIRKRGGSIEHNYSNLIELDEEMYATTGIYCLNQKFFDAFKSIVESKKAMQGASIRKISIADIINHSLKKGICVAKAFTIKSDWFSMKYKPERILAISKIRELIENKKYPEMLYRPYRKRNLKFHLGM